ncbi:MAG: EamA family transporter [Acetobacteraceae bacterium]|nr:EamA family transporter [Acetobacteraceae bacterium]
MSTLTRQRLMFGFVCLVWGSTWIAMKNGATHVPPALFAGLRWTIAGIMQLFYVYWDTGRLRLPWNAMRAILIVAVLVNTLNQLFMLYGLRYVASGIGAVINSGLTPLSLLAFAMIGGHERLTKRVALAMGLGVLGIVVLFGPSAASGTLDGVTMLGAFLVMMGTLVYSAGSVLARPITQAHSPTLIAGLVSLIGGLTLLPISFLFEPGTLLALRFDWGWGPWISFLFLLFPASLGATTIFMILVRDWGPSRAGSFAFISPILAVFEGMLLNGEAMTPIEGIGMALMLGGAWFALRKG